MNSLSLFLYLADILGRVQGLLIFIGIVSAGFLAFNWVLRAMYSAELNPREFPSDENPHGSPNYQTWAYSRNFTKRKSLYIIPLTCFLLSTFIPSKDTIYMIAASEVSEMAVTSDVGQEILTDIKTAIKNILKGE